MALTEEMALVQRRRALARANEVRFARRDLKRLISRGELTAREAVEDPDAEGMLLRELLEAVPWVGRKKADRALRYRRVSPLARIGTLSVERRHQVLDLLPNVGLR